jgi:hypothetical protein
MSTFSALWWPEKKFRGGFVTGRQTHAAELSGLLGAYFLQFDGLKKRYVHGGKTHASRVPGFI